MKKIIVATLALSLSLFMLSACGSSTSEETATSNTLASEPAAPSNPDTSAVEAQIDNIYRGKVTEYNNGQLTVEQVAGHNYGQSSIIFNISDDTTIDDSGIGIVEGAFVEVTYDGALTRSLPPQGNAQTVKVIASYSDGVVQNGVIQEVSKEGDDYYISILPIEDTDTLASSGEAVSTASTETTDDTINTILIVPANALEGITESDLVKGAKISAVTSGIATASLPPQMPVVALLAYSVEEVVA